MPTWPATLPDYLLQRGYSEQRRPNVVRSQPDAGPAKARRRFTAAPRNISGTLRLNAEQVEVLDAFHVTDCMDGTLPFDWTHPRTGAVVQLRFGPPPTYTTAGGLFYDVALALEVLP